MLSKDQINFLMLGLIPIAFTTSFLDLSPIIVFIVSVLGIIPLAVLIVKATEEIAEVIGPTLGGLLNATFSNLTVIIVTIIALRTGFIEVVEASILGSIIANLLLALGLSIFLGGLHFQEQIFASPITDLNSSSLLLAILVLLTPRAIDLTSSGLPGGVIQNFSYAASILLLLFYLFNLVFVFKSNPKPPQFSAEKASSLLLEPMITLFAVTIVLVVLSQILVGSLDATIKTLGFSKLFTGIIVVPLFGGIVQYITCGSAAIKNKMELSLSIVTGSTLQMVLFVTPVLVLLGFTLGQNLSLEFNAFGMFAAVAAVLIANSISSDGKSNWLEGLLLLIFYSVLGVAFYLHP